MALSKYKLVELIKQRREKYDGSEELPIRGVAREGFISPKQDGADLSIYNVYYLKHSSAKQSVFGFAFGYTKNR